MTKIETSHQTPSASDQLQLVVDDILSKTTLTSTDKMIEAAEALGMDPAQLLIGERGDIHAKFAAAIEPIKAVLEGKENPTRSDIARLIEANQLLDQLIAIQRISADDILAGYKKLADGVIELTLPLGTTVQEAGILLNAAAKTRGIDSPIFYERDAEFWQNNEADPNLQTIPGRTYQFHISPHSVSKNREEQVHEYGAGAPLGAIAIAEACERLNTENSASLFQDTEGNKVWIRGATPSVALGSSVHGSGGISSVSNRDSLHDVAYASLLAA